MCRRNDTVTLPDLLTVLSKKGESEKKKKSELACFYRRNHFPRNISFLGFFSHS